MPSWCWTSWCSDNASMLLTHRLSSPPLQSIIDRGELVPDHMVLDALLEVVLNPEVGRSSGGQRIGGRVLGAEYWGQRIGLSGWAVGWERSQALEVALNPGDGAGWAA